MIVAAVCADSGEAHAQRADRPSAARARNRARAIIDVRLVVGADTRLDARGVRSYSTGGTIYELRMTPAGDQFVLRALRVGTSSLLFVYADGSQQMVHVTVTE